MRALERSGRTDDARRLELDLGHAASRAWLASLPAWTHEDADPERTRSLDVEPLRTTPRVRAFARIGRRTRQLLVSPFALVTVAGPMPGVDVRDLSSGERRFERELPRGYEARATITGETLVTGPTFEDELLTGRSIAAEPSRARLFLVLRDGARLVRHRGAWELREPSGALRWSCREEHAGAAFAAFASTDRVHLVGERHLVLDRVSGAELAHSDALPVRLHPAGWLARRGQGELACYRHDGFPLWRTRTPAEALAVAGTDVIARVLEGSLTFRLCVLDGASGEPRLCLEEDVGTDPIPVAVARDVVVAATTRAVFAATLEGERLWTLPQRELDPIRFLALGPARVYGATRLGDLFVFERDLAP